MEIFSRKQGRGSPHRGEPYLQLLIVVMVSVITAAAVVVIGAAADTTAGAASTAEGRSTRLASGTRLEAIAALGRAGCGVAGRVLAVRARIVARSRLEAGGSLGCRKHSQ